MEDQVTTLQSDEEFKKFITALSEWISSYESHIWKLVLSDELADKEVALRVNLTLTATQLVVGNYFGVILEGPMGRLGIKTWGNESPTCSFQEHLERCFAEALQLSSPATPFLEGCHSRSLHARYSLEFADEGKEPQVPALLSTALPSLLDSIDHLCLRVPPPSKERYL